MLLVEDGFKVILSLVTLSFVASFASVVLAIIYTFVHSLNKSVMLLLIIIIAAAAGNTSATMCACALIDYCFRVASLRLIYVRDFLSFSNIFT